MRPLRNGTLSRVQADVIQGWRWGNNVVCDMADKLFPSGRSGKQLASSEALCLKSDHAWIYSRIRFTRMTRLFPIPLPPADLERISGHSSKAKGNSTQVWRRSQCSGLEIRFPKACQLRNFRCCVIFGCLYFRARSLSSPGFDRLSPHIAHPSPHHLLLP